MSGYITLVRTHKMAFIATLKITKGSIAPEIGVDEIDPAMIDQMFPPEQEEVPVPEEKPTNNSNEPTQTGEEKK